MDRNIFTRRGTPMNFQEFVVQFQQAPQETVIELHRTYCACHWKEVWVADSERLPYLCHRLKELTAG